MSSYQVNGERAAGLLAIVERRVEQGRATAQATIERIERDVPEDRIVRGAAMRFKPAAATEASAARAAEFRRVQAIDARVAEVEARERGEVPRVVVEIDGRTQEIGRHAFGQFAERAHVPARYLTALAVAGGWQTELAAHVLETHYSNGNGARYLVRSVRDLVRGFLTDSYCRRDARPLLETACEEFAKLGAVPIDGVATETRVALKALIPTIYEPVPGEFVAFGLEWSNSDFGDGAHNLRNFIFRPICTNGAVTEDLLRQIHLGKRLSESVRFSDETYEADTKASRLALRDTIRGYLEPAKIEATILGIRAASEHKVEWRTVAGRVGKRLLKSELDAAREAFNGQDTINLPAGNTAWRASNALSWLAGKQEDPSRRLVLERLAGEVITGKSDDAPEVGEE